MLRISTAPARDMMPGADNTNLTVSAFLGKTKTALARRQPLPKSCVFEYDVNTACKPSAKGAV